MNKKDMARVFDFKTTKIRLNCERFRWDAEYKCYKLDNVKIII